MTRHQIEQYERDSLLRAGFRFNAGRNPGDDTAQQIIRNSERRKAEKKQSAGEMV